MKMETIFRLKDNELKHELAAELRMMGYNAINTENYLYAPGETHYMLIAHLDTVHKEIPSIICYSKDKKYMMSPQGIGGDDRCGVYIILQLLRKLKQKPYILFTMGEEIGGVGAEVFTKDVQTIDDLKFIVEFDRKGGNDCVFYDCENLDFIEFVEQFGFKEAFGSFSDISVIAPHLGVAAVNLSSGYYNPHMEHEYVNIKEMNDIVKRAYNLLNAPCERFEYIEAIHFSKYNYSQALYDYSYDHKPKEKYTATSYYFGYSYIKDKIITDDKEEVEDFVFDSCMEGYNCTVTNGNDVIQVNAIEYVQQMEEDTVPQII